MKINVPELSDKKIEYFGDSVVFEIENAPDSVECFRRLSRRNRCVFFDSASRHEMLGRYSFLAVDPFDWFELPIGEKGALARLKSKLQDFGSESIPGLPPFQGGAAGLFSYDLNRSLERIAPPSHDEFGLPAIAIGFYDLVVAWNHDSNQAWIISQGFPEIESQRRRARAISRLEECYSWLSDGQRDHDDRQLDQPRLALNALAKQFPVPGQVDLLSNFSKGAYLETIQKVIDYIYAGDVFQVNLAQRLLYPANCHATELYIRLRECNPAPFAAYFDLGDNQIVSASPERFVSLLGRSVETRPIKGTRRRMQRPEADLIAGFELVASEKDRAENVMIVDLLRNDLSRVCVDDSITVIQLCQLEKYQSVLHLVSVVRGELLEDKHAVDLLTSMFPGGSITGAPKVRAMQIIAELEPTARGAYCGSLGYIGFDGTMDSNILIRSITASQGWWQIPVGGGIVAESKPLREYEETATKATGMLRALEGRMGRL